ncbi:MAG: cation:proton antiporter [Candidatus Omnitrophica bacterium]|nr:cation:proton antiporter [Candidatus Omnitrophota bacterium]
MLKREATFYFLILVIFGVALWFVLEQGKSLQASLSLPQIVTENAATKTSSSTHFLSTLENNSHHPLAIMIVQIFCIMIAARVCGFIMTLIGQPSVVGEIIAGIALGPSLIGAAFPDFSAFLFPEESLRRLHVLSQIGLVLFMFIIGMELDVGILKKKAKAAVIISHTSIIFLYFLGVLLAYFLYPFFSLPNVPFLAFALFMGIAMSITAFPVLARIIQERNLTHTPLGTIVITCAASDDITAWCLLALVIAIISAGGMAGIFGTLVLLVVYILFMWFFVRPILHRMAMKYDTPESIDKTVMAAVFGLLLVSSYITEILGIHALFGAFLAGVIMPPQKVFKRIVSEKIEDVSMVLFLPLFFVFTGLRTEIGLLNQANLWSVCFLIIGVAVAGKFIGSFVAAKFTGQSWRDSLMIGVLMNTRGLMELVVLNIGFDLGVISTEIFTMMVLMALVTTFMTGPAMNLIEFFFDRRQKFQAPSKEGFSTLLSFGAPHSGSRLLKLAYDLNLKNEKDSSLTAIHFSPSADISLMEAEENERQAFSPISRTAERFGILLRKVFRVTDHVEKEILETVQENLYDIILMGSSRDLFKEAKTSGLVKAIIEDSNVAVGVLIDKNFIQVEKAALILSEENDLFLLKYAQRYLNDDISKSLTVFDKKSIFSSREELMQFPTYPLQGNFRLGEKLDDERENFSEKYDVVIVSHEFWVNMKRDQNRWLYRMPSVLIINR